MSDIAKNYEIINSLKISFFSDEVSESKKQKTWNGEKARPVNASVTAKQADKVLLFIVDVLHSQFLSQIRYTAQKSSFTVNFPK